MWVPFLFKKCVMLCTFLFRKICHTQLVEFPRPQLINFQSKNLVFLGIYLNFQQQKNHLKFDYLPHSESNSYQINFINFLLIKILLTTNTQKHIPNIIIMESSPCTPSSSRAFQTQPSEHDLKHPGSVDLITTKQNKLPSFIDRCNIIMYIRSLWIIGFIKEWTLSILHTRVRAWLVDVSLPDWTCSMLLSHSLSSHCVPIKFSMCYLHVLNAFLACCSNSQMGFSRCSQ
jgi:hypothetical protein